MYQKILLMKTILFKVNKMYQSKGTFIIDKKSHILAYFLISITIILKKNEKV